MIKSVIDITGMGCLCAAGNTLPQVMAAMYSGERRPAPPVNFSAQLENPFPVFEIIKPLDYSLIRALHPEISPADWNSATRTTRLTMIALAEALEQSKLTIAQLRRHQVGVAMGTTVGCTLNNEPFYRAFRTAEFPAVDAIDCYLNNNPAQFLAEKLRLRGPVATVANACSSGADAIGLAKGWLEADYCDLAIAGGADELTRITYLGFISLLVSSPKACMPFDKNRSGLNLGEGAGMLILEKDAGIPRALAHLCGYGTYTDAYHPTAPHPDGPGLRDAIGCSLLQAGIGPTQIGFINAHGTSTANNDSVEGKVIAGLFGITTPVVSTKSYTGHTLGAAGAMEAIFTAQALLDRKLPASLGFSEFDEECGITPLRAVTSIEADYGLSNSLAFGGNNSALVIGRMQ
jgi:3-oxoacyl-[acyl-carrier-protein] synthase-1/3-oxoacyl-[acyl-carrier-protein] synthase II